MFFDFSVLGTRRCEQEAKIMVVGEEAVNIIDVVNFVIGNTTLPEFQSTVMGSVFMVLCLWVLCLSKESRD